MKFIVKTLHGLENVLADEMRELGINDIHPGRRAVSFSGGLEHLYKANYGLRTAIRILNILDEFQVSHPDKLYKEIYNMEWERWFSYKRTIAVDSVVSSDHFRHSRFVSQKVKDAIVDRFRAKTGLRPSVDLNDPDVRIHVHIYADRCSVSLDSSGESLHKRGYRRSAWMAPLNEVLAAGMILLSGWSRDTAFIDPMCGSGTLLIEAAMIGKGIPAGIFRNKYCFQKWQDYDEALFEKVKKDMMPGQDDEVTIRGFDISQEALTAATKNINQAGLRKEVKLKRSPFQELTPGLQKGLIITNPPYGERLEEDDLVRLYKDFGDKLKHDFAGFQVWILSGNMEAIKHIGLRTSRKLTLYNGAIQCKYHRYDLYEGSKKTGRNQ